MGTISILPTVNRYFFIASSDIKLTIPVVIPATQFTNDLGNLITEFIGLGQNSYNNLYINGILQEGSLYVISANALTINPKGNTIFLGSPIVVEIVQFTVQVVL
ncbi:DUF4183 domain-containing protein [Brevibacillus laterosporus]|uniref:DUF4183 domain-containing protein n=1 Tax=Brevibacillus laterosporus TaxID=1465 RepID=UPI00215C5239|nr:DUF4183 domain-containing protein [Brevibacillus laterosporus]MCZ0842921.1 DUF4183 domain-containing protein [Brevibacillus laterosporus]